MALPTTYSTGTASINANETAVTGQGTTWLTSGLQAGDLFWAGGMSVRIASVNSNTSLTLAFPWPAAARAAASYEVRFTPDATRVLAAARSLLDSLTNGVLYALGNLPTAANKLAYFTGAGAAALADITAHARSILGLGGGAGKFLASSGANVAALRDIVGAVSQSGGVPTGSIVERGSNANGEYVRLADGTQICTATVVIPQITLVSGTGGLYRSESSGVWNFPAAFVTAPSVSIGTDSDNIWCTAAASAGACSFRGFFYGSLTGNRSGRAIAIGRWF